LASSKSIFRRVSSGRIETVREFPKGTMLGPLAASPDGRWVLYMQPDQFESDIMLVENFR
jgi:hypothetical protein